MHVVVITRNYARTLLLLLNHVTCSVIIIIIISGDLPARLYNNNNIFIKHVCQCTRVHGGEPIKVRGPLTPDFYIITELSTRNAKTFFFLSRSLGIHERGIPRFSLSRIPG